jgi:hypothetical protein
MYALATFSRSDFSPRSSSSSSVVGTQKGSRSSISYLSRKPQPLPPHRVAATSLAHPLKINWGLAAPEVRFLMSEKCQSGVNDQRFPDFQRAERYTPSAKPKLSATGSKADTVKNEVPSFISSDTMRPLRFATTPYIFPRTSAGGKRGGAVSDRTGHGQNTQNSTRSLNVARIHCQHQPRRPIEQPISTSVSDGRHKGS